MQDNRVYTYLKIAKITYITISFSDHCNAISIDTLPSKTKIGKDSWYFNSSLLCKSDFSSGTKDLLSLPKTQKPTTPQQVAGGNTLNVVLKRILEHFLKIPPFKKISRFPDQKPD